MLHFYSSLPTPIIFSITWQGGEADGECVEVLLVIFRGQKGCVGGFWMQVGQLHPAAVPWEVLTAGTVLGVSTLCLPYSVPEMVVACTGAQDRAPLQHSTTGG